MFEDEAASGLTLGNQVILCPSAAVTDGAKVTERKDKKGSNSIPNK